MSLFFILQNRRTGPVWGVGTSGSGEAVGKGYRRVNIVQILCTHIYKCKNSSIYIGTLLYPSFLWPLNYVLPIRKQHWSLWFFQRYSCPWNSTWNDIPVLSLLHTKCFMYKWDLIYFIHSPGQIWIWGYILLFH
jgi:hypothetical protein